MYHYLQADVSINTIFNFNTAFHPFLTHTITYLHPAHSHIMRFKMASIISFIVIHKVFVLLQRWRIILMKFFGLFCARAALCASKNEVLFFRFFVTFLLKSFTLVFVFIETVHFTRCLLNVILTIVLYEFPFQNRAIVRPGYFHSAFQITWNIIINCTRIPLSYRRIILSTSIVLSKV